MKTDTRYRPRYSALFAAIGALVLLGACSPDPAETDSPTPQSSVTGSASGPTLYLADRIIIGDGTILEPGILEVSDGIIIEARQVGALLGMGDEALQAQFTDLSGMTIMPAIVDAHVHLSTTREAALRDLRDRARVGVSAALSLGADGTDAPMELRGEAIAGHARYLSAGRGITSPEPGRSETPHWVTSAEQARAAVREEAARGVDMIKIWVDDRDGRYEKLSEAIYTAAIDEAHAHDLRVAAHIFALEDAKGLLRAGVDIFAHGVRDRDVDDEFIAMMRARPQVVLIPNLPARGVATDLQWLRGMVDDAQIEALESAANGDEQTRDFFVIQARNLARLNAAGVTIAMGTDGNTFWAPHVEMQDMVAAGMTNAEVLIAATRNSAAALGLDDSGVLAAGRRADFIVLGSNPLADITATRDIVDVYLDGVRVDR